jgi:prevent-host-death family protein
MSALNIVRTHQVSIDEIKQNLAAYLQRANAGEVFVITKAGKPLAEIRPVVPTARFLRPFGLGRGEFSAPDDFDAPLPEQVVREFED